MLFMLIKYLHISLKYATFLSYNLINVGCREKKINRLTRRSFRRGIILSLCPFLFRRFLFSLKGCDSVALIWLLPE